MSQRHALLTGATGFVGSHLCRHLLAQQWRVTVLVRPGSDTGDLQALSPDVAIAVYDENADDLAAIMAKASPDIVFHLASLFLAEHSAEQVGPLIDSNVRFGARLLEAMSAAQVRCLINTGTFWQHYHGDAYRPVNLYAATKQAFEAILAYYTDMRGITALTLKLSDTYGPQDKRNKLISLLQKMAREGGELKMSPGEQQIDIVHIDDAARAFIMAAERCLRLPAGTQESYAVSSGQPLALRDLVGVFEDAAATRLDIEWGARPYREREVMHTWQGGTPVPGWQPQITLRDGFAELVRTSQP